MIIKYIFPQFHYCNYTNYLYYNAFMNILVRCIMLFLFLLFIFDIFFHLHINRTTVTLSPSVKTQRVTSFHISLFFMLHNMETASEIQKSPSDVAAHDWSSRRRSQPIGCRWLSVCLCMYYDGRFHLISHDCSSTHLQPEKYWDTEFISHYQNTCKLLQFVHSKTILISTIFPEGGDRHSCRTSSPNAVFRKDFMLTLNT